MPKVATGPVKGQTFGDMARKVGNDLGLPPDDDQCEILDAIYRVKEDDAMVPACFEVAIVAPRQNIKTSTLEIAALTDLFVFGEPLAIWTAHLYSTSTKTFRHMRRLIEKAPEYRSLCRWPPRTANGDQAIELLTGEAIEFYARSKRAIRGFEGVAKITLDEALFLNPEDLGAMLPTVATVPGAQIRYASSAGLADSEALRAIRNRGHAGEDELAYFEWYAPHVACADERCSHQVGAEGCALDNQELWAEANPALGRRISKSRMQQFRRALPPAEFAREFLTWWDEGPEEGGGPFGNDVWEKLFASESFIEGPVTFAVEVSEGDYWACIGAAGRGPLGMHVESVAYGHKTNWVVERAKELAAKHSKHTGFVIQTTSPAGALLADFRKAGLKVIEATTGQYAQGCGQVYNAVLNAELHHLGQTELDLSVSGCRKKPAGDAFVWDRRKSLDISPLAAVTLAFWGANQKQRRGQFYSF